MSGLDPYEIHNPESPFSVFMGSYKQKSPDPYETRENTWTMPNVYKGESFVLNNHVQDLNMKGFDGDYMWADFYRNGPRCCIRFYTLFACLARNNIYLPMELHVYLWDIYKKEDDKDFETHWMCPDAPQITWNFDMIKDLTTPITPPDPRKRP